ncbi:MAG: hypothetical protein J7513_07655 [Solirubrobacteraceae bacterium]|nr:hypothetical protein [Solirubrobacteraceae bacterium]
MPDATISPRGIPPIRTDWIADVAWRLAAAGLERLGELGEDDTISVTDQVDGAQWRIEAFRISEPASWVEFDGDLFLPTDRDRATMRVALAFVPSWDAAAGTRVIETRVEVGPRGAVTFDPENWMLRIPDPVSEPPAIEGVVPGAWQGLPTAGLQPVAVEALAGRSMAFGEVVEVAEGATTWIVSLPIYGKPAKQGFLARLRGEPSLGDPEAMLVVEADGPLTVDPAALLAGEDFPDHGTVDLVEAEVDTVKLSGTDLEAAGGWIGIAGPGIRVSAHALGAT